MNRDLFAEGFSVNRVLTETRSVPLEDLAKQVKQLTESVQDELFELINNDFVKFQELLRKVCDVDMTEIQVYREQFHEYKKQQEVSKVTKRTFYSNPFRPSLMPSKNALMNSRPSMIDSCT